MTTQPPISFYKAPPPNKPKLEDIKISGSFSNQDIQRFLEEKGIKPVGDTNYDACLFQAVLFTEFFKKIEKGEIDQNDPHFIKVRNYCLKKQLELLLDLKPIVEKALSIYEKFRSVLEQPDIEKKWYGISHFKEAREHLVACNELIWKEFFCLVDNQRDYVPVREKICVFIFIHATLSDYANEIYKALKQYEDTSKFTQLFETFNGDSEETMQETCIAMRKFSDNTLLSREVTENERTILINGLAFIQKIKSDAYIPHAMGCFSKTGAQGIAAILWALMFSGKKLLSGAANPYEVHNNTYKKNHIPTLSHDAEHLFLQLSYEVFSSALHFREIFLRLMHISSPYSQRERKVDLLVIFHILHENPICQQLISNYEIKDKEEITFLSSVEKSLNRTFTVIDTLPLLRDLGFELPELKKNDTENKELFEIVQGAMNTLWVDFRKRHLDLLEKSHLKEHVPGYFL